MPKHQVGELVYNINSLGVIIHIDPEAERGYKVKWITPVIEHESTFAYNHADIKMFKKLLDIQMER